MRVKYDTLYDENKPIHSIEPDLIGTILSESSSDEVYLLTEAEESGHSFQLDLEKTSGNGMFDDEQLYAIYEKEDLEGVSSMT